MLASGRKRNSVIVMIVVCDNSYYFRYSLFFVISYRRNIYCPCYALYPHFWWSSRFICLFILLLRGSRVLPTPNVVVEVAQCWFLREDFFRWQDIGRGWVAVSGGCGEVGWCGGFFEDVDGFV